MIKYLISFFTIYCAIFTATAQPKSSNVDFEAQQFSYPPPTYGPYTRWWWPGNDVSKQELKREVNLFVENGFAGVEIQPLTVGINPESSRSEKIYSWDTPSFYSHINTVMKEARKLGLMVDLNAGSGWPMGGTFIGQDKSLLTLTMSDTIVSGDRWLMMKVPSIKYDYSEKTRSGVHSFNPIDTSLAQLLTVTAARITIIDDDKIHLDSTSFKNLNSYVKNGKLSWRIPAGKKWVIMAFYSVPNGEKPAYIASRGTNHVVDYFDSEILEQSYERLFGKNTGLDKYYNNTFRAVFSDSKEFIADRLISNDFIGFFKKRRGYDISPWLVVNAIPGYDNVYSFGRDSISRFRVSKQDWRLRYDYDLTISDLYKERFSITSRNWMEKRGLLHRTQDYGIKVDIIGASGLASIPETEQLFGRSSEALLKLVSSGANLYNRPITSAEAFVFSGRFGMTTPQVIKAYANKAFAAGVNQLVYHGTPYQYKTEDYSSQGWTAWSTPFKNFNYSSNISEGNNYWKYIKDINLFLARSQYALQSGKSASDVLIYFPFINLDNSGIVHNPEEFINGLIAIAGKGKEIPNPTVIQEWFIETWPLINQLERHGITWDFVNDESLLETKAINNNIDIRGNLYKALILPNVPYIPLKTVQQIEKLTQNEISLLIVGGVPGIQPSYFNYEINDQKVKQSFKKILSTSGIVQVSTSNSLNDWAKTLPLSIKFKDEYDFIRQVQRQMSDGSILRFIWNKTNEVKEISLILDRKFVNNYWLYPEDGSITKNSGNEISYKLQPHSAILVYASTKNELQENKLTPGPWTITKSLDIKDWNIRVGDFELANSTLFDWIKNEKLQYSSDIGIYTTHFDFVKTQDRTVYLDMGDVYYTAEVFLNNEKVGTCLWPPYRLDISKYLKNGNNTIKVLITPADRNGFLRQSLVGNPKYPQYKGQENTLMPGGLIGPVVIKEYKNKNE